MTLDFAAQELSPPLPPQSMPDIRSTLSECVGSRRETRDIRNAEIWPEESERMPREFGGSNSKATRSAGYHSLTRVVHNWKNAITRLMHSRSRSLAIPSVFQPFLCTTTDMFCSALGLGG